jgi:hypothetical protein
MAVNESEIESVRSYPQRASGLTRPVTIAKKNRAPCERNMPSTLRISALHVKGIVGHERQLAVSPG